MKLEPFKLERFFAKYEFNVEHQISASDCESMSVGELLRLNGEEVASSSASQTAPSQSLPRRSSPLQDLGELTLGYTESAGDPRLRGAIGKLYRNIDPGGILIAAPEELIFLLLTAHLKEGDHVIVTTPAYQSLTEVPRSLGCRVSPWPVELNKGRWHLDFNFLERELGDATKMVIVNIPHNPTGFVFTQAEKEQLTELVRRHGTLLFADEMYQQLEYAPDASSTPFCDMYEKAISLSGLSKSYGLPGLRIGWLAAQSEGLLEPAAQLKDYTSICNSAPSELLARAAVKNSSQLVERCRTIINDNLQLLKEFASRRRETIELIPGQGGSVVFPRFIDGRSAATVSKQLIQRKNLLMLPGPLFDMGDSFFRVGLGRTSFPTALSKFEELVK